MSSSSNQQWTFVERPKGLPTDKTWSLDSIEIPKAQNDGDVVVKALFVTVDPYLRGRMQTAPLKQPITSGQVAEVVESKSDKYKKGDTVVFYGPWARYSVSNVKDAGVMQGLQPLPQLPKNVPVSSALGVLGMPGMTAYFGTKDILQIQPGETVVVSGAGGAVGSLVGQIAKHLFKAGRVIGTAGGKEKCEHLTRDLGFDVALDYKQYKDQASMAKALQEAVGEGKGIDCYFDNTGGHVTDAVFDVTNKNARVAICGQISIYNATETPMMPNFLPKTIYKDTLVRGFIWSDFAFKGGKSYIPEFYQQVAPLIGSGEIKFKEHVVEGFEKVPEAFASLFEGANTGKLIVKV